MCQIFVNVYECNVGVRVVCIVYFGIVCWVCEIDLVVIYGEVVWGYIQVYYLWLLVEVGRQYEVNLLIDLIFVCLNCYVMFYQW